MIGEIRARKETLCLCEAAAQGKVCTEPRSTGPCWMMQVALGGDFNGFLSECFFNCKAALQVEFCVY